MTDIAITKEDAKTIDDKVGEIVKSLGEVHRNSQELNKIINKYNEVASRLKFLDLLPAVVTHYEQAVEQIQQIGERITVIIDNADITFTDMREQMENTRASIIEINEKLKNED